MGDKKTNAYAKAKIPLFSPYTFFAIKPAIIAPKKSNAI